MADYKLPIHKPYDFDTVLGFLERHAASGIEAVKDSCYLRYVPTECSYGTVLVKQHNEDTLGISITRCDNDELVLDRIKCLFDTSHDPASLPVMTGIRAVGSFDPFEISVSIILGQLITIQQATNKMGQLIQLFGRCVDTDIYSFPMPSDLMNEELEKTGITKTKATAIRQFSRKLHLEKSWFTDRVVDESLEKELLAIKGIGPWTTQLILMRCFSHKDAFPDNDLFVQRAIKTGSIDVTKWDRNRAYLAHYIWKNHKQSNHTRKGAT